jgi:hypothetical protein
MSKNRVWNKGKRNGGGGPVPGTGYKEKIAEAAKAEGKNPEIDYNNPINQVRPMKRENWVQRPVRVIREQPKT